MRKITVLLMISVAFATSLSAQITRKQADTIIQKYLQNEMITYNLLYVHANAPNEEGITITTSNEETFTAKYACWTYFVDENNPVLRRYLFVKEDDGNLLEVIASNDLGTGDLNQLIPVETTGILEQAKDNISLLYPNPVDDWLTIPCTGKQTRVEIHDLKGTLLFSGLLTKQETCRLNVSFLTAGVYLVSIYDNKIKNVFKIIKN
jgi:hypothetical protein